MYLAIELYFIICVLLLVFDLVFLVIKNRGKNEVYRKNEGLGQRVQEELAHCREEGAFHPDFLPWLTERLGKTRNLLTLMGELEQAEDLRERFRAAVFAQIDTYEKKGGYDQAYYAYVISTFDYSGEKLPPDFAGKLMGFLDSRSLYTFSNTMGVLYKAGQVHLLVSAIDKIDQRQGFYHKKLLVDGLLSAKTELPALHARLLERFDQYASTTKDCLLDFFRMSRCDISELCLRLLRAEDTDDELRYDAMRYFARQPNDEARAYFLRVLGQEDSPWLDAMLAVQGLDTYSDPAVRGAIKDKIYSDNWYVRTNAISYLRSHGLSREEICAILEKRDRYTNHSLLYQYRDDSEMSQYITQIIAQLERQDTERRDAARQQAVSG